MDTATLTIDGQCLQVPVGTTILEAARRIDIYIPTLCHHPNLPPAKDLEAVEFIYQAERKIINAMPEKSGQGCGLCVVEVEGIDELVVACTTEVKEAMVVSTLNDRVQAIRQEKLLPIMTHHRHACLTCAQQEGCPRTQCSANVPEKERCCFQFGHCELQNVASYIGIMDSTPGWIPTDWAVIREHPLFERDYNLCIGCTRCVRACRDLRGIEALGLVYDKKGRLRIGTLAESLEASGCKFCTACVAVCPTGAMVDKSVKTATKEEDLVPCKAACPAHIDVPGYVRMIAHGRTDEANAIIREKVPFPGVLGRVCIHPCEQACRRGAINEPIAICALKRYAADYQHGLWKHASKVASDTGKKVAVVGAGPAGMTAAFYLRKQGHSIALFDSSSQAGGMMRYGIPEYRLPQTVLNREIKEILDLGVEFRPNQTLAKDFSLDQLKNDGFDAIFLGLGAQQTYRLALEGCQTSDVLWGVEFLRRVAEGEDINLKDNVVVIGGGNVAVDAAMSALRCGATNVTMICLECLDEMPAGPWEIESAKAEGVQILPSWGPEKIISEDGQVTGIDLVECTAAVDDQGSFCPVFSDKKECILVDQVIVAVGQAADLSFLDDSNPIKVANGLIVVSEDTLETVLPGIYAGGDIATAAGAIIHAIAAGRRAAASIDRTLGGDGDIDEVLFARGSPHPHLGRDEGFAFWARQAVPELEAKTRVKGFQEVATGYSADQAVKEAKRCLQCDLRLHIKCNPVPPLGRMPYDEEHLKAVPETEGVYQLLDAEQNVLIIKGTANLRQGLLLALDENDHAVLFKFEEDKMYSRREIEIIQNYLQAHGKMPGTGADDLDDLF